MKKPKIFKQIKKKKKIRKRNMESYINFQKLRNYAFIFQKYINTEKSENTKECKNNLEKISIKFKNQ